MTGTSTSSIVQVTERILQLQEVKARALEAGTGEPTICIHGVGFTSGAESWLPAIRAGLADHLHVYAMDNIGWGAEDRPVFEYSMSFFVDFIREVQDELGYSRTNIIGHSLGGWIAAMFAYESPDRVRKLVLDNIAGMNPTPPATVASFKAPTQGEIQARAAGLFSDPKEQEEQAAYNWRNANVPGAVEAYAQITKHLNDPPMRRRYYLLRRLGKIRVPTLVVWGRNADGLFPLTAGQDVAARIPNAKLAIIDDAGHFANQEKPTEFATVVGEFLA